MITSMDPKFTRSLQNHNLENLVFEKRQRKPIQPIPQALPPPHHNTHNQKKIQHKVEIHKDVKKLRQIKASDKKKIITKTHKTMTKRKYLTLKDLKIPKNIQAIPTQIAKSPTNQTKLIKTTHSAHQYNKKALKVQQKSTLTHSTQRITRKASSNIEKVLPQKKTKLQQKKNENKIREPQIKEVQEQSTSKKMTVRQRGKVSQIKVDNDQNDSDKQNIDQNDQKKSAVKSRALQNLLQSDSKKSLNEQPETPKPRQAKLNALKRYSQKDMYADESFEYERGYSNKRKRIFKPNTHQNYSINRIFRKEAKLDLNPINIDVKLDKLSLSAFSHKFGTFDIIHSSLPLSMLWQITNIQSLMVKGFIFIWVEKGQIPLAYHFLNRLGYDVIDQIVWIKCSQPTRTVFNEPITQQEAQFNQQSLFLNSKSVCFVGYKCPTGQKAEYRTKISNNLIFAEPSFKHSIKKPDQIFQIADLLMPGSKKLQLGGIQQNGWLSLRHHETRLRKCIKCLCELSTGDLMFKNENTKDFSSICRKCYKAYEQERQDGSEQSQDGSELSEILIEEQKFITINQVQYLNNDSFENCTKCKANADELIVFRLQKEYPTKQFYCKQCFHEVFNAHETKQIQTIQVKKTVSVSKNLIVCQGCQKTTLCSHHYECISSGCRNKRHILCQVCFWKSGYDVIQNQAQAPGLAKKKNDGLHEWRLKKIVSVPCDKLSCSSTCKTDLLLPYFVCETCVGWKWCGKCKLGEHQEYHKIETVESGNNGCQKHKMALIC